MSPNPENVRVFPHTWLNNSPSSWGKRKISSVFTISRSEPLSPLRNNVLKKAWSRAKINRPEELIECTAIFRFKKRARSNNFGIFAWCGLAIVPLLMPSDTGIFIAYNLTADQSMICQQLCNWPIGYSVSGLTEGLFTSKESAIRLFSSRLNPK